MSANMLRECSRAIDNGVHFSQMKCHADAKLYISEKARCKKESELSLFLQSNSISVSSKSFSVAVGLSQRYIQSLFTDGNFKRLYNLVEVYKSGKATKGDN